MTKMKLLRNLLPHLQVSVSLDFSVAVNGVHEAFSQ